ncbi:MAG: hypothetical protein WD078_02475, partial [Woeseia sp.]
PAVRPGGHREERSDVAISCSLAPCQLHEMATPSGLAMTPHCAAPTSSRGAQRQRHREARSAVAIC